MMFQKITQLEVNLQNLFEWVFLNGLCSALVEL